MCLILHSTKVFLPLTSFSTTVCSLNPCTTVSKSLSLEERLWGFVLQCLLWNEDKRPIAGGSFALIQQCNVGLYSLKVAVLTLEL